MLRVSADELQETGLATEIDGDYKTVLVTADVEYDSTTLQDARRTELPLDLLTALCDILMPETVACPR